MSIALRHLARPLASISSCNAARAARTHATNTPTSPLVEAESNFAGKTSSEVASTPEGKDVVPVAAEIISGAPGMSVTQMHSRCLNVDPSGLLHNLVELRHRLVRIFQPTRNTMQSGGAKGEKWRIDWDVLPGAGRWQNPLMGWASSYVLAYLCPV